LNDQCVFCKIIKGEISAYKIFENDNLIVILDLFSCNLGHSLIIPKVHFENILNIDSNILSDCFLISKVIASSINESLSCDGINILQNNKNAAGQTIDHFHIHVIPRFFSDSIKISWLNKKNDDKDLEYFAEKIKNKLRV
jgi:histidine triad (HIT) family protein